MGVVTIMVTVLSFLVSGGLIVYLVVSIRDKSKLRVKRRQDMLDALRGNSDTIKQLDKLKVQSADYKFRLAEIAKRHVDSIDVPGYCAVDDEEWPCATANLANLRKNAKLVE